MQGSKFLESTTFTLSARNWMKQDQTGGGLVYSAPQTGNRR
jgi:hypothetical protein